MREESGGGCSHYGLALFFSLASGCSGGEWLPEVDGPPKGDERLYYSAHNHADTRSRAEVDQEAWARKERSRQDARRDDTRDSK